MAPARYGPEAGLYFAMCRIRVYTFSTGRVVVQEARLRYAQHRQWIFLTFARNKETNVVKFGFSGQIKSCLYVSSVCAGILTDRRVSSQILKCRLSCLVRNKPNLTKFIHQSFEFSKTYLTKKQSVSSRRGFKPSCSQIICTGRDKPLRVCVIHGRQGSSEGIIISKGCGFYSHSMAQKLAYRRFGEYRKQRPMLQVPGACSMAYGRFHDKEYECKSRLFMATTLILIEPLVIVQDELF